MIPVDVSEALHFIDVTGPGFLYKMVRNLVGTLVEVGSGMIATDRFREILKGRDRTIAGATAPPQGLCLMEVRYA